MINLNHAVRVFLHTSATNLRKGFDAISGLVTTAFAEDPMSGHLLLLVNRRLDRLKILYWVAMVWQFGTNDLNRPALFSFL